MASKTCDVEGKKDTDPLLQLILQKYVQAARDSIRGPIALKDDLPQTISKIFNKHKIKRDIEIPDESQLKPTKIDGFTVGSFNVGGEKRLSFTEVVQKVLKDVNAHEIFKKRDKLLIFTSKCSPKQLDDLKYHRIVPWTTTSSNLITKSDAFRLVGALKSHLSPKNPVKRSALSFEVYHECFGGCIGVFDSEVFTHIDALCIRCTECNGHFSPQTFVSHNHTSFDEVHTCHWGFDSVRWRSYLMLVERKVSRELLTLWQNTKSKFGVSSHHHFNENPEQDAEFVAYIQSPDQKKAMISPIESLRCWESQSEQLKQESSAFRPWSQVLRETSCENSKKYFPNNYRNEHHVRDSSPHHKRYMNSRQRCGCLPTSPVYADCKQCTNIVKTGCHNNDLQILAQKASEKTEIKTEPGVQPCSCRNCNNSNLTTSIESSINEILLKCTSHDMKMTTNIRELTRLLSNELKNMEISQEDRIHEESVANQRLKTELHLFQIESEKKVDELKDTKAHVELELETLRRERQKEISIFNQMKWELSQEVNKQKSENKDISVETLKKEIVLLKVQLEQSVVDRENLHKQLTWQLNKKQPSQHWTPYPSMARKFSDSEDEQNESLYKVVVGNSSADSRRKDIRAGHMSPATKTRRLDSQGAVEHFILESPKSDDNSDIEVET